MKPIHALRLLTLAGFGPLLCLGAAAQQDGGYFYGGASAGQARSKLSSEATAAQVLGNGFSSSINRDDRSDTGYKLFGGYQLNRYLGLEAGLFRLGRHSFTANTVPAGDLQGEMRFKGMNLDLVATLPLGESWAGLMRLGGQRAWTHDRFIGSGAAAGIDISPSARGSNYKVGLGLQYAMSSNVMVRAEMERYRVDDALGNKGNVNMVSVGLVFPFGGPTPAPSRRVMAPNYTPVAQAPTPVEVRPIEPMPVAAFAPPAVPAPLPMPRRVSFSAEALFGFDQSTLSAQGQAALDTFAREAQNTQFDTLQIEGHTDRLGSSAYNQTLSQKRADAVKDYLVRTSGLASEKLVAQGKSESMPVTKTADCKGSKQSAALILCLQPDRRVDIELVGTR